MEIPRLTVFTRLIMIVGILLLYSCREEQTRVLVFSKTVGYRHESIAAGIEGLQKLAKQKGFVIDTTEDAGNFNEENLKRYKAVVFLNTTGDVLNHEQQNDFERFIQAGGGFVGIHAAADTEYNWPWYGKLVGAWFDSHPQNPNVLKGTFHVVDRHHPATDSLPRNWQREDEFYNFKKISPDIKVLLTIDEKSYAGGTNGPNHPMAWYHEFDGGRAFYTNMGHTKQTYSDPLFLKHLWGGIYYVTGGAEPTELNYKLARSKRVPEENRFSITVLGQNLNEPIEFEVLRNNKVLLIERKGKVKLYDPGTAELRVVGYIPVSTSYAPKEGQMKEAEDGLLGIALDPQFEQNRWVYLYYSPAGNDPKNILARYEFDGDSLVTSTRKVILEVPVQREECCHTGGSMAFDKEGNLYISTGDNTSPRDTPYSPIDERTDRGPWDAQKSSANTNDLRGKILRIHPEPDGSYTIPEGNLFPQGAAKTRPEIYVMGARNPYRISYDKRTGYLYWGDVGPDAEKPDSLKGPAGYDEINQARQAGFFGWPYFVGNNKAYTDYDFTRDSSGTPFDPLHPLNYSPNNTGLNELPPAKSAYIWYPYKSSGEFPLLGSGGRTAMAGPVYYLDDIPEPRWAFPGYYNGKLFIYDWIRGWIMAVTMDKKGNYLEMEHFMPSHKFGNIIDMTFAHDGTLYVLEYGTGWFQQNEDARLIKIEYNPGNRKPVVEVAANRKAGATPLAVGFTSKGTKDYDRDPLRYEWEVKDESAAPIAVFSKPDFNYLFEKPGLYKVVLTVTDSKNEKSSAELEIRAGNEAPVVNLELVHGNQSFYFPGETVNYLVRVNDREDGSLAMGNISAGQVAVTIDSLPEGYDIVHLAQGHRAAETTSRFETGRRLIEESDCRSCHSIEKKSLGPPYLSVAEKYAGDAGAAERLANKVIKGGGGVWGEAAMAAHPQLDKAKAIEMVKYILSLSDAKESAPKLKPEGSYTFHAARGKSIPGAYVFRASYTDRGANSLPPLSAEKVLVLRKPILEAAAANEFSGPQKFKSPNSDRDLVMVTSTSSDPYLMFRNIDLTGVEAITFTTSTMNRAPSGGKIEVRLNSPNGPLAGVTQAMVPTESNPTPSGVAALKGVTGFHNVYFVFKYNNIRLGKSIFALDEIQFAPKHGVGQAMSMK